MIPCEARSSAFSKNSRQRPLLLGSQSYQLLIIEIDAQAGCQLLPYLLSAASQLATDVHNEFLIHSFNLNIGLLIAKVRFIGKKQKKVTRFSPYPSALLNLRNCLTQHYQRYQLASKSENGILYHTGRTKETGQDYQCRKQEKHLARKRKENSLYWPFRYSGRSWTSPSGNR